MKECEDWNTQMAQHWKEKYHSVSQTVWCLIEEAGKVKTLQDAFDLQNKYIDIIMKLVKI